jgi:ABC-2 type transport system ATP-binding protein
VVLTTHAMDEAERLADHVVVVAAGRVVAAGSLAALTRGDADTVRFSAVPGLPVGELAACLGTTARVREVSAGEYVVDGVAAPVALPAVTAWCAERGVLPDRLSTGRRSLEDVFLGLTGEGST